MRIRWLCVLTALAMMVSGCKGELYIEKAGIVLTLGLDLEGKNRYRVYHATPVFNKEAERSDDITSTTGYTLRQTENIINSMTTGQVVGGKIQSILIGKAFIRQQNVYPLMDVMFRVPQNETNARVIVVDGPVRDVIYADVKEKGRLGVVVRDILDTAHENGTAVLTDLLQFHRQMLDKRITPSLAEMSVNDGEIAVTGTALLDQNGKYVTSLNREETALLLLLQQDLTHPIPLTFRLKSLKGKPDETQVSLEIQKASFDVQTDTHNDRLVFDIAIHLDTTLTERVYAGPGEEETRLEARLEQELTNQCERLFQKLQQHRLDPIGLGVYAKAYEYQRWKAVQKDWGSALSKAAITVSPRIQIVNRGVSM
jgi:Ger(x)C family germination protein